ncbi:unnamed protein product, partial [Didymodactylos carnosus]
CSLPFSSLMEISALESSLPNELYDFIFLYLKSIDIIYSFFNLNHHFNNLIYPFLCAIDLSNVDECTLKKYCRTILPKIHHHIKAIRVDDKNINAVFPLFLYSKIYPNLESVFITEAKTDGKHLLYLKLFKQLLNLKIYFGTEQHDESVLIESCSNLFQTGCGLQTLVFENVYVPINTHIIERCFSIRKLTIKVHCCDNVYVLLNNLPSIESVTIDIPYIREQEQQPEQEQNGVQFNNNNKSVPSTLSKLRYFVFSSMSVVNYDYLELLLSHCCFNLEHLSLVLCIDQFIDGERFEKKLLSKLTKLEVFHFCFLIPVVDNKLNIDDYIQTFKSSYWINNNHSILCFNQSLLNQYYCVFSLPYVFHTFPCFSNDLINYRTNVNDDSLLYSKQNRAIQISLYDTVPYTSELFQIIQKSFLRASELIFVNAPVRCLSDNLLNNELMMENIVSVTFLFDQLEFEHFRLLLLMTPNILRLRIPQRVVLDVLRNSKDSSFQQLRSICNRIRYVGIGSRSLGFDALMYFRIARLFPKAKFSGLR